MVLRQECPAILGDSADGHYDSVRVIGVHLLGNEPDIDGLREPLCLALYLATVCHTELDGSKEVQDVFWGAALFLLY